MTRVLAGDVGGSKTLLQVADYADGEWQVIAYERYDNHIYVDLEAILAEFFRRDGEGYGRIDSVCLAVAGPIQDGKVELTNLPWSIDTEQLRMRLHTDHAYLINDIVGAGYGITALESADLLVLHAGMMSKQGVCALIGAGTGLGEAWMAWCGDTYEVFGGEGGHVDFAPRDALEVELLAYLSAANEQVSYEHVLSGAGLKRIFDFLREREANAVPSALARDLVNGDPAAVICDHALNDRDPLAVRALDRYISIYGAQAANLALTVGARGGVYLVGGIAPKISAALSGGKFIDAFLKNPTMSDLLKCIPVSIVLDTDVALLGARNVALSHCPI